VKLQIAMGTNSHGKLPDLQYKGVPFVSQTHINLCADACVNMLLLFYDVPAPASFGETKNAEGQKKSAVSATVKQKLKKNEVVDLPEGPSTQGGTYTMAENPRGALTGLDSDSAFEALKDAGLDPFRFDAGGSLYSTEQLETVLEISPFICSVQFSAVATHAILVFGIKNDTLFYHDPWRGSDMSITLNKFNEAAVKDKKVVSGFLMGIGKGNAHKVDYKKFLACGLSTRKIKDEERGVALP
jgi:hypothetical protein